jgi:ribose transport system substrate-binding protein
VKAVEQAGRKGDIKVIGFDESDETQAGIESGAIYSSVLQDQYRCGYETVYLMADALRGENAYAPTGVRTIHLRTWVLKADNIAELRTDKMVHQPGAKNAT